MKCMLPLINAKELTCFENNCAAWDSEKNCCSIKSTLLAYVKNGVVASQVLRNLEQLNERFDEIENEEKE
ncbi:hypothetical protein M0R04_08625 [Candidatus Dojkabacteria bacterium]|nr:hypothetical protein [Candidatus Dojkabacteria bacterium]